ncbi:helix-turn-helix transcriptional regulator [Paractinoplanes durhamensis]|uniref:Transcriptional regulator n=1 Tax=Paractinoplanes durhamensis TaxID=113563 RepID=A0ABQ3Z324_9ACTN|nr:WYL domain-containing protein [Actinoplanes durhamensis]GIE04233.1 transcriptional regulator [Actinoplanes durhamensis]
MNPTARALQTLDLVQSNPGITADRLAAKLDVSERAARRYVGFLREAGIPIESSRGPYGGYRIGRGLRLPPLMFTAGEALGLVMAVLDGHHDAAEGPAGAALGKIMRALPEPVAAQAAAVRQKAAPAPDRAAARPDPAITAALVAACEQRHRTTLRYRTESGTERDLPADPWAVVIRHGRWYLLCGTPNGRRAYRVDRVLHVEPGPETFEPPADLDPVKELEEHLATGWEFATDVLIDAPHAEAAPRVPPSLGRLTPAGENRCRLTGTTSNPRWYAEQLAAVPVPFTITGSPELKAAARRIAHRLLAATD